MNYKKNLTPSDIKRTPTARYTRLIIQLALLSRTKNLRMVP